MKFRKNLLTISICSTLLAISACSVTEQDAGLGASDAKPVSGLAIDGYLARAVVYADTNENNKLDVWEKRALTDGEGYFSYNPNSVINYCDLPSDDAKSIHCLNAPAGYDEVTIRMTRGYDLTTVEPFTGTISMKVDVNSAVISSPMVASPLTGLLSEMTDEEKTTFYSLETGVDETLAASDFLNFAAGNALEGADADRATLIKLAMKTHKVADVIAGLLDSEFDQGTLGGGTASGGFFNVEEGIPVDASVYVYRAMVAAILDADSLNPVPTSLSAILADNAKVTSLVDSALTFMKGAVTDFNNRLPKDDNDNLINPSDAYLLPGTVSTATIVSMINDLVDFIDTAFTSALDATDLSGDVTARLRAISIYASMLREDNIGAAARVEIAVADNTTASNGKTLLENLRSAKADIALLKQKFRDDTFIVENSNFDGRQSFTDLIGGSGTGLTGSNSEGFAGNTLNLGDNGDSVGVVFDGATSDATSGTMTIDAALADGDFEGDFSGDSALTGTWEQLDEYTMLMNIEVAGVIEPVIIKPTVDDNGDPAYYFDMGDGQEVWNPGS